MAAPALFTTLLRPGLHASSSRATLAAPSAVAASFSTTAPALASRERRMRAKAKRDRNIALQQARRAADSAGQADPVLGYVPRAGQTNPWEGCRLQRILLRPEAVYSAPPTTYATGESPAHYLPGLSHQDQQVLFGALPHTSVELKMKRRTMPSSLFGAAAVEPLDAEEIKVEQMKRVLDLRNANKKGIEVVNRQRVIQEFGGERAGAGLNTGSSEVQAALLTQKIRSMAEHLITNPKDNSNRRSLRSLVHQRQQILRYFKRKQPNKYDGLLVDLGLEKQAVEGEISM